MDHLQNSALLKLLCNAPNGLNTFENTFEFPQGYGLKLFCRVMGGFVYVFESLTFVGSF